MNGPFPMMNLVPMLSTFSVLQSLAMTVLCLAGTYALLSIGRYYNRRP